LAACAVLDSAGCRRNDAVAVQQKKSAAPKMALPIAWRAI